MPLSRDRVLMRGHTPHVHERQAIEFIEQALPDSDPMRLWALVDLPTSSGRRYEIDALVLGYQALYVVEIKSHPARVTGNAVDWRYEFHDGGVSRRENPLRLTAQKARVLAGLLDTHFARTPALRSCKRPWVEPLVFLSHESADCALTGLARHNVLTRKTFAKAITYAQFPGVDPRLQAQRVDKKTGRAMTRALAALGVAESVERLQVGELLLDELIEEGPGYQDREAHHERMPERRQRVRTYLVPESPGADLAERNALFVDNRLSVALASDDLAAVPEHELGQGARRTLDEVVGMATERSPLERADSAIEWVNLLLEAATTPDPPAAATLDPIDARPGDRSARAASSRSNACSAPVRARACSW